MDTNGKSPTEKKYTFIKFHSKICHPRLNTAVNKLKT